MPTEWTTGDIVNIPKKGDLSDCWNWREIQVLSLPSKVYTRLILERIRKAVDAKLRKEQAGFRKGRPSTNQTDTLHIIIEQLLEWHCHHCMSVLLTSKKAFDMVDRTMIWLILRHYGIPQKIVIIIQCFYEDNSCRVIHNTDLSAHFTVNTGVRQG